MVTINGQDYEPIEREENTSGYRSRGTMAAMLMAMAAAQMSSLGGSGYKRKYPDVDLVREYGLIESKRSELTKAERDHVVWQFNRIYRKVDGDKTI
jgi:basic membrane lipoprotein Med (substrate-binding protein (PBP1-ABC) superfamily)